MTVTVTTASGSATENFTYVAAPTVTSILPTTGPTAGGTSVTLTGTNLTGATAVDFGSTPGTIASGGTDTSITATSPPGSAGPVNVTVTTAGGTDTQTNTYTYVAPPPTLSGISPASGPTAGGTPVTLTGTNLTGATVEFGSTSATVSAGGTDTSITATSPAESAGPVTVTVTTASGSATENFTYVPTPPRQIPSPSGNGYWLVASDGGIFSCGDAGYFGSRGALRLNAPIVGLASTPDGKGYWLVASDGGVFAYGDAGFYGSTGGLVLNKPIVGIATTPDGKGYWLVASDGGVFAYGDAALLRLDRSAGAQQAHRGHRRHPRRQGLLAGGLGRRGLLLRRRRLPRLDRRAQTLNKPIVGIATTPDGRGYWLVGLGRWRLHLRRRPLLRLDRRPMLNKPDRGHRRHP